MNMALSTKHGLLALIGLILSCSTALAASDRLSLTGSSTVAPLLLEIGKRYESLNPAVRVDVQTGGSSRGIQDARMGTADAGMVSRALKPAEKDLTPFLVAMDGIGMIVHQSNPIKALSDTQIKAIYTGKINNWQQVGGKDQPITVVTKAEGRSTLELFLEHFELKNSQIKPQVVIGDNQQGVKTVAGNPGAIGYVSIGAAEYEHARAVPIKLLPMDGKPASVAAVAKGQYPFARELNLVVKGKPSKQLQDFIAFAQSAKVNDLIDAQFLVSPRTVTAKAKAGASVGASQAKQ